MKGIYICFLIQQFIWYANYLNYSLHNKNSNHKIWNFRTLIFICIVIKVSPCLYYLIQFVTLHRVTDALYMHAYLITLIFIIHKYIKVMSSQCTVFVVLTAGYRRFQRYYRCFFYIWTNVRFSFIRFMLDFH